ncbi:hypothetical protein [Prochlorococcus sp. MIT 1306]|uniref:hypothetical protein n=1 Tax=Prochlorococcus sp. MIT 1306 TaxID=1799667 RepID=UPI0007B3F7DB|nr:hypothetical protein [Prochlorococcus sp. MIT 1306]
MFIFNLEDKYLLRESPFVAIMVVRLATKLAGSKCPTKDKQAVNLYKPKRACFHNKSNSVASIDQKHKVLKAARSEVQ